MQRSSYIKQLKYKWIFIYLIQGLAICIGFTLLLSGLMIYCNSYHYSITILTFLLAAMVFLRFRPIWKIDTHWVIRYLDTQFRSIEDSAGLLLKNPEQLSQLERLQLTKIQSILPQKGTTKGASSKISVGLICLAIGVFCFYVLSIQKNKPMPSTAQLRASASSPSVENVAAPIADYLLSIYPPAYTGKTFRSQQQFTLKVEVGATVNWAITTTKSLSSFQVIFSDKEQLNLRPQANNEKEWHFSKKITHPGFYQLIINGVKSDLYQIELIPDHPVNIKITQPKPQTTIDIGQAPQLDLRATLSDDYGISEAFITATMASGKGESVSFTEKKLNFATPINNQKTLNLQKQISLKSLGMKPGDELYYYIQAKDNKGQESRSDVYSVSMVDTAELMSMVGMTSGVNLVPEYFRSQRQIILDTEKLLAEKASINQEEFKKRSNNLGVDQKLLRLRYGQFLGEENETQIGGEDEHHHEGDGHDHGEHQREGEQFGDVKVLMDKYSHKHDIAEDATFFEPAIKAQLKAVLNEMWKAELNLRTYKAQEALPFEYKALRLLKDLQQKSRAYVAKTTIKTTALKMEKRLTGELDQITNPQTIAKFEMSNQQKGELQLLLALLATHSKGKPFDLNDKALLQSGEKQLVSAAANRPASFLAALNSLRRLSNRAKPDQDDIRQVSRAIYQLIGKTPEQPQAKQNSASKKLSADYFNQLKQKN